MVSIAREFSGECFDFDCLCATCLGGLVLKRKQKEALSRLLEGKDVLAVLPTGFGKSLIYQSFILAKEMVESSVGCSSSRPSCLVIVPLRFAGDKRAGFSRGRDDCFEVDCELYAQGFFIFLCGETMFIRFNHCSP